MKKFALLAASAVVVLLMAFLASPTTLSIDRETCTPKATRFFGLITVAQDQNLNVKSLADPTICDQSKWVVNSGKISLFSIDYKKQISIVTLYDFNASGSKLISVFSIRPDYAPYNLPALTSNIIGLSDGVAFIWGPAVKYYAVVKNSGQIYHLHSAQPKNVELFIKYDETVRDQRVVTRTIDANTMIYLLEEAGYTEE